MEFCLSPESEKGEEEDIEVDDDMAEKKGKDAVICPHSESEEEDYEVDDEETSSQSCSDEGSDWNEEEEADFESSEDSDDDEGGSESTKVLDIKDSYNRVIHFLRGESDVQELKLVECKAYLRKHGLRLTGNKAVCIQRMKEHWRIEDGMGEKLYPRSSFFINCTGDVCTGDVVLFTQRVHERYDKVTRNGDLLGKRTIAGKVVKESYGAAKQQHTFTVEVLWSKGFKRLPPLFPLLVKGRNLYRFKTFRQRWDNEEERSIVLAEKHKRGGEARRLKATRTARPANQGCKHTKQSDHAGCPKRRRNQECAKRQKHLDSQGKAPLLEQGKPKRVTRGIIPKSSLRNLEDKVPTFQAHSQNGQLKDSQFMGHENRGPCHVYNYRAGSALDAMRLAPFRDCTNQKLVPTIRHRRYKQSSYGFHGYQYGERNVNCFVNQRGSLHQGYNQSNHGFHSYPDTAYQFGERNINNFVDQGGSLHPISMEAEMYGRRRSAFLHCPMRRPGS
ncbi:zinc finger CCCH domain-containing protein 62-like [Telopea speciosissima]|uniref:zinc finger CCCH domain-containing protein 62-like n=1 Tax=Telopea speciosissima TaxID=54955 RepID=UPI001CC6912B|nr:zinc finger CCCH domain-containing protein 62-like [Telopea speciosissima]